MKWLLILILFFTIHTSLIAQLSIKQLDQQIRSQIKHKLTKLQTRIDGQVLLVTYVFKTNRQIFSVSTSEEFKSNGQVDSIVSYQFDYVNDTLLRVWYQRANRLCKKCTTTITAYFANNKIIAVQKHGDLDLPNFLYLKNKSKELRSLVIRYIDLTK